MDQLRAGFCICTQVPSVAGQGQENPQAEDRAKPSHYLEFTGLNGLELTRISEIEGA